MGRSFPGAFLGVYPRRYRFGILYNLLDRNSRVRNKWPLNLTAGNVNIPVIGFTIRNKVSAFDSCSASARYSLGRRKQKRLNERFRFWLLPPDFQNRPSL